MNSGAHSFFVFVVVISAVVGCDPTTSTTGTGKVPPTTTTTTATTTADAGTAAPVLPVVVDDALLAGVLPPGPERELAMGRCVICHTEQYLTQQRLTPAQWQKTVDKMRKWGAPLSDVEGAQLAVWLGRHYPPDLPERRSQVTAAPPGATTPRASGSP